MDQGVVTIKYSPVKWAQAMNGENKLDPNNSFSLSPGQRSTSPSKGSHGHIYARRKYLRPLSSLSFQKSVQESIVAMKNYAKDPELTTLSTDTLEQNWYGDLLNVGQRLKLLRDAHKVVQTVRKKKAMGLRVDFKPIFETRSLRYGSPAHLDDESSHPSHRTEDDDDQDKVKEYPPPARRGRPRKKRGRERKVPLGRPPNSSRTRLARKQQEHSPLPQAATPTRGEPESEHSLNIASSALALPLSLVKPEANPLAFASSPIPGTNSPQSSDQTTIKIQRPPGLSIPPIARVPEPQGPPLMYLPPILPSQRLQLVQGIPPYRHMREIEVGVDLGVSANNDPANEAIASHKQMSTFVPKDSSTNILETHIAPHTTSQPDETNVGPEVSEISAVFRQLAEDQANLPASSKEDISYANMNQSSQFGNAPQPATSSNTYQIPFKNPILNPSHSSNLSSPAPSIPSGAPVDYELQRVELELAAALEETSYPEKDKNTIDKAPLPSDQSFINRLLN